jgi:hypothetical protein
VPDFYWLILACVGAIAVTAAVVWQPVHKAVLRARLNQAKRTFHRERERLEARFIRLASSQTRPDAPRWSDCDFDDSVSYVRNRATRELSAFVAVTVALEGVDRPTSPTTTSDLIGNLRAGTAVFRFDGNHWATEGRAILNLTPREAIRFFQHDLEVVAQELTESGL